MSEEVSGRQRDKRQDLAGGIANRVLQLGIQTLFLAVVLFVSSGRLDWVWAWIYLGVFVLGIAITGIILYRKNPEVIAERTEVRRGTKRWDRALTVVYALLAAVGLQLVAGLDVRFGWTSPLPLSVHVIGLVLSVLGYAFASWAMAENTYFACTVRIQQERGHTISTTGPYQYVRHAGYSGWSLSLLTTPLLLGSPWALVPGGLVVMILIIRTVLEDRTLRWELNGYQDYVEKVHYRWVPGVW